MSRAPLFNIPQRGEQPTAFFKALSEADNFVKEIDRVSELETRLQEITAERDELREELARLEARK